MQAIGFFLSLELYFRKVVRRNPLPYPILLLFTLFIVALSLVYQRQSITYATSLPQAIRAAAAQGDYILAQQLLGENTDSDLVDIAYPERKIVTQIRELEEQLVIYPGNRDIYKMLANLYGQIGNQEKAAEYSEQARILDPNEIN